MMEQTRRSLAVYDGSAPLQTIVEHRDGFFFPIGRGDLIAERWQREARSRRFLDEHAAMLQLVCALPFTRLVALSGSVAHLNLEPGGDLDLFIVTRGRRVWTVTIAVLLLAKLLRRRRVVCANFVLADSHSHRAADLFTAAGAHLKPLIAMICSRLLAANHSCRASPERRVSGHLSANVPRAPLPRSDRRIQAAGHFKGGTCPWPRR